MNATPETDAAIESIKWEIYEGDENRWDVVDAEVSRRIEKSRNQIKHLLADASLQLSRLTGPSLETYARIFATLAKKALE